MTSFSSPAPPRRVTAVLLLVVAVLAGCGGSGGGGREEADVEALLDRAFTTPLASADVKIDAQLDVEGLEGLRGPLRFEAGGIYVAGRGTLPKLDLEVKAGAQDAGQAVELGVLSTGDRAFIEFGGEFYEQPKAEVDRANRELRRAGEREGNSPGELGLKPREWVVDARREGEEEIAKTPTDHVSARLDIGAVLADLNGLIERTGATGQAAKPLSNDQLEQAERLFESPRFDVYVGKADSVVRRMSANLEFTVPDDQQARLRGARRGSLRVSVELTNVNSDQRVRAPADARPISDLASQLQGLGALGGAGGLGLPRGEDEPSEPGGGSALERYDDCLDQAAPDDTAALSRCSDLLR